MIVRFRHLTMCVGAGLLSVGALACEGTATLPAVAPNYGSLMTMVDEAPGENCVAGGHLVQVGLDDGVMDDGTAAGTAGDGVLDEGEVTASTYLCQGANGADGTDGATGPAGADGAPGETGAAGEAGATSRSSRVAIPG